MRNIQKVTFGVLISLALTQCSILKKEDPEKGIRAFIAQFEKSLSFSDAEILKQFDSKQSDEAIMAAINVLQNKDMEYMKCDAFFSSASFVIEDEGVRIEIPVRLNSENLESEHKQEATLTLWLKRKDNVFVVSAFEGDEFYNRYLALKNDIQWSVNKKKGLLDREQFFERAQLIQQQYDSVIWYANYLDKTYYYVVTGSWRNYFADYRNPSKPTDYKMGLVDQDGTVIVPVEYDLVGSVGIDLPNIIEVRKDNMVGYFSIEGELLIPAEYKLIVPYRRGDIYTLVKKDTTYGWISTEYVFNEGLPSGDLERLMHEFEFLPTEFTFSEKTVAMCEIPNEEYVGYGIVMPPSYWTANGVFSEIIGGFTIGDVYRNAYTEYIETTGSFLEQVTDKISALIITIKERYLEGREEFYVHDKLVFVNEKQDTLATGQLYSASDVHFKKIDSTLIEIKYQQGGEYWEGEYNEYNVPTYRYFRITNTGLVSLNSNRMTEYTEFVRMDSSYITGEFTTYNQELQQEKNVSMLSVATLTQMRDEILASYGYAFKSDEERERFKYYKWYSPKLSEIEDVYEVASDIDKHNLAFLAAIIGDQQFVQAI